MSNFHCACACWLLPSWGAIVQVRIDTGIVEGSTISMYYDPMISKVTCLAPQCLHVAHPIPPSS